MTLPLQNHNLLPFSRSLQRVMSAAAADVAMSLQTAALLGRGEIVQAYLDSGAAVDEVDSDGCTALYHAANSGHANVVRLLLQHGAALNISSSGNNTPLHIAVMKGHAQVVLSF